jgi:predicted 3-demethylubiquinone-9 3-methyltransferase (glyoxalase superfamily)
MIRPCIVYEDRCEEALNFYVSLFPNSRIKSIQKAEADGGPIPKGKVLSAEWILDGCEYTSFDGGPTFTFTEGFSLMVTCKTQAEIDLYWSELTRNGGEEGPCGWCTDRFGLSWQIIPDVLGQLLSDSKSGNNQAAMQVMLSSKKLDIAELEKAYRGSPVA